MKVHAEWMNIFELPQGVEVELKSRRPGAANGMGNEYYMVKNSWGKSGTYEGIWYASKAFARYKTMNIVVHKDALPKAIAKKLGIK